MPSITDRATLEAHVLHQEIVRLDTMVKQKIDYVRENVRDEHVLHEEMRCTKELLASLESKISKLKAVASKLASKRDQLNSRENIERHSKELNENRQQFRSATVSAQKAINELARSSLLEGGSIEVDHRAPTKDEKILKDDAAKTTERLSALLSKMGERVAHSEQTMDTLVHSSSVLAQTHTEFASHASHIQTGNKLLSKYERRELTDKILVTIALIFYFAVVYYILQKRVFSKFWLW